jgi:hypothetical protein
MYFVYIVQCTDGSLYTGITTDVERRFLEHQEGKGGHYTRSHRVKKIVYTEKSAGVFVPPESFTTDTMTLILALPVPPSPPVPETFKIAWAVLLEASPSPGLFEIIAVLTIVDWPIPVLIVALMVKVAVTPGAKVPTSQMPVPAL